MSRPPGSNNIKESKRQAAVRLVKEGKDRGLVLQILVEMGAKHSSAVQYYTYAKKLTNGETNNG